MIVPIAVRAFFTGISSRLVEENLAFESPFVGYFWNLSWWLRQLIEVKTIWCLDAGSHFSEMPAPAV